MSTQIETSFGFSIVIDEKNKNLEIRNKLSNSLTIITPMCTKIELELPKQKESKELATIKNSTKKFYKKGKFVGELINGTYITNRTQKHFMRKFQGFGISEDILKQLNENSCLLVEINYDGKEDFENFLCPLSSFLSTTKVYNFEGNDLQMFVSIKDMSKIGKSKK